MQEYKQMEDEFIECVKDIGAKHGFKCYVIASSEGGVWRGGDFEDLEWSGLVSMLFGGVAEVMVLIDSLDEMILPQVYQQGEVYCLLMKPAKDIVVGYFSQDGRDAVNLYREGKEVSKDLQQRLRE
jgi:hypothetical protein